MVDSLGAALDQAILWRGLATAAGAGTVSVVARLTGTPTRARTVALVALVGAQLGPTLAVGGHSPVVAVAAIGSVISLAAIVQTPGASQLFGCRPLGPLGWATGVTAAACATAGAVVLPSVLEAASTHLNRSGQTRRSPIAALPPG